MIPFTTFKNDLISESDNPLWCTRCADVQSRACNAFPIIIVHCNRDGNPCSLWNNEIQNLRNEKQ